MGASCGTINCKNKKYQKYPRATIINRPTPKDFSEDTNYEDIEYKMSVSMDSEHARVGVYFQLDALLLMLPG